MNLILEYSKFKGEIPLAKKVLVKRDGKKYVEAEVVESSLIEKLEDGQFKK
jgi:hypothetical protein